jgi:GT2 family glycosyltransferase
LNNEHFFVFLYYQRPGSMQQGVSRLNTQSELIRSLQKQLAATERELADQKWVFEQFLRSPSWRLTSPLRWMARHARSAKDFLAGKAPEPADGDMPISGKDSRGESEAGVEFKDIFAEYCSIQLRSLLASGRQLTLGRAEAPVVSIIVVLFNRAELTLACLRSIREYSSVPLEVIIVDNASSDETPRLLERIEGAQIIRNRENIHFLHAVNQAVREARGKYVLLLNNDAQLLPGALEAAMATFESSPDIGAVGGRIILLDGVLQEAGSIIWHDASCLGYGRGDDPFAPMYMFRRDVDYCSAAFLLTSRSVWHRLGGFDEAFAPAYYEETDYCTRLWEHGYRVVYEPNAALLHYEFASSRSTESAILLQQEHQRVFAEKHRAFLADHRASGPDSALHARTRNAEKRVLLLDDRAPHSWLGSGFPRAHTMLRTILKEGYFATLYPSDVIDEEWSSVYSDLPQEVEFMRGFGRPMLQAFLRNRQGYYKTILVSRPHNMALLKPIMDANPSWFEDIHIIYDAEALFATRTITQNKMAGTPLTPDETDRLVEEEVSLARHADCTISVSDHEAAAFRKHGIRQVEVLGHALPADPTPASFEARNGFLFVGAIHEESSPNGDAALWFMSEILPKIRSALGMAISFTIAGVSESAQVRTRTESCSARLLGRVPDLTDVYDRARVFVAPTRYGAGLPHKVHEAAARGLPVVATPLLVAQLGWQDGLHLAVGAGSDEFAAKCIDLYTNEMNWTKIRQAALDQIRKECSIEAFEARLKRIMEIRKAAGQLS